jgi:hypothetical protein
MKALCFLMATTLLPFLAAAGDTTFWGFENSPRTGFDGKLWKTGVEGFSPEHYRAGVARLLSEFERETGKRLAPGALGKAALKVYSNSGAGLGTPPDLVRAVIEALEARGFSRDDLCILDARSDNLRSAGFLPPLSRIQLMGPYFDGVRVYALDRGDLLVPAWFYDSPLPQEFTTPLGRALLVNPIQLDPVEARKSYLPGNLLTGVDFWINLPVATHHPATGLGGALVNATLWNITNGTRFFNSPANAPVAVAEIASIPELQAGWALNLVSLEGYQFIAGPAFNANYTASRRELWMSVDPVVMDAGLIQLLNVERRARRFSDLPAIPEFIQFAMELGVGRPVPVEERLIGPPAAAPE